MSPLTALLFLVGACVPTVYTVAKQISYEDVRGTPYNVSFDERAFTINGERQLFHVGAIHYARATPEMWPSLIRQSRAAGLNAIDTYMFWDLHEEEDGVFDFESFNRDFIKFIQLCAENDLYVQLRIGPYINSEWNLGAIPSWLMAVDGIVFRTFNEAWMFYMERFIRTVVERLDDNDLLPSEGGPVIFLQIENEYGHVQSRFGADGTRYVEWCADLAVNVTAEIPWFMCEQPNAPLSVIETINGHYAEDWLPEHFENGRDQPAAWTENYPAWFHHWGESVPYRPTEDLAYSILRWFQRGGTLQTYYMWFGGTNFGRGPGGPYIVTSYDYNGPLSEYGYPHPESYRHLTRMHAALDQFADAILGNAIPDLVPIGDDGVEVSVYGDLGTRGSVIFLANTALEDTTVEYNGHTWDLKAWSVSIIDGEDGSPDGIVHSSATFVDDLIPQVERTVSFDAKITYTTETPGPDSRAGDIFKSETPLTQLPLTVDKTDYFWYSTVVTTDQEECTLELENVQNVVAAWANGIYLGLQRPPDDDDTHTATFEFDVSSDVDEVTLDILTISMGLPSSGAFLEETFTDRGLNGAVVFNGDDVTAQPDAMWLQQPFLAGEVLEYFRTRENAEWQTDFESVIGSPLVWFDVELDVADVDFRDQSHAYALNLTTMGKGTAWMNGNLLGRFWDVIATVGGCADPCPYPEKPQCNKGCNEPSQSMYHVPRDFFEESGTNRLVLFTEVGGDPTGIQLVQIDAPTL